MGIFQRNNYNQHLGSPVRVKVCGIRRLEDVETALNLGAEFIGVNVYADSPRSVTIGEACELVESIPKGETCVG